MILEDRYAIWNKWEERLKDLWVDLEWQGDDFKSYGKPDDVEAPIMEELFNTAVKMYKLVCERRDLVEKVYWTVEDKQNELRRIFHLDEDTLPVCAEIDYKTLQEVI